MSVKNKLSKNLLKVVGSFIVGATILELAQGINQIGAILFIPLAMVIGYPIAIWLYDNWS